MAEKGSLSGDNVSLPPTYAPSEAYTESPPPAYRGTRGNMGVRIARLVCCTLLAITFLVGFFVITHKYIQGGVRECNCPTNFDRIDDLRAASLFAAAPAMMKLDNNKIEDDIASKDEDKNDSKQIVDEIDIPEDMLIDITDEKDILLPDIPTEEVVHEVNKDVKLPKDILFGNPNLVGKNVQCRVEKKQQKLAEEIMTQTIIVTCDDNEEDEKNEDANMINDNNNNNNNDMLLSPSPLMPKSPPVSLFGTLMKIIAENSRLNKNFENDERPQFNLNMDSRRPRLIPIIRPIRPDHHRHQQEQSFPGPIPFPFGRPDNREGKSFSPIIMRRPPPEIIEGVRRQNVLPHPPPFMPPFIRFSGRPQQRTNFDFLPENNKIPIKIVRLPPPIMNEEIPHHQIPLLNNRPSPVDDQNDDDDEFTPILNRFFPFGKKVIHIRPTNRFIPDDILPIRSLPSDLDEELPMPRFPEEEEEEQDLPVTMPEASARALPAPVALPDVKLFRLPLSPQIPEKRLMTHMEVREPKSQDGLNEPDQQQQQIQEENLNNQEIADQISSDFGPPRDHTLFNSRQPFESTSTVLRIPKGGEVMLSTSTTTTNVDDDGEVVVSNDDAFDFLPQPLHHSEGRFSQFAKMNSDAEMIPSE